MTKSIEIYNVSKKYKLYSNSKERIKDLILPKSYGKDFWALKDIDFVANQGDVIGFLGINGSGKSTLSNIIAGIVPQTMGEVKLTGQASLIAVASGLKGDLTGRQNIELKCLMLGFSKKEIKYMEAEIIDFSELEEFIDQPVKSYSSGMKSRLGFAISVTIDPDILIIDEALSVGDKAFAEKSLTKMEEFKSQGKTMIFVSHSLNQVKTFCDKILWLEYGKLKEYGPTDDVVLHYEEFLKKYKKMTKTEKKAYKKEMLSDKNVGLS
ncbi:teichoic acids export ABC transporter ATP-binding subunit TagH [Amphibacillus cookii]|uniref:teichoic acids export ABC transporter ATP-binding subunit TagH n=1 Tax=Amphibacillus cookii TaxID=767787 RepID=UPI00195990D1|nr:teichoic acids export ABC transporter ATP-binding subunit TagH [Amphibacillus cookii]MBM7543080.1 teichoic acid transport system ATP-binding protein [Amphibacillus cookii]